MVEPEVVATSPNRIKSPVPVYCGFSSMRLLNEHSEARLNSEPGWATRCSLFILHFACFILDLNGAHGRIRTRTGDALNVVSLLLDYASKGNWILQPVMLRQVRFTKAN